jgi:sugar O-acyltransferase (sialic acid O-acetyltransferase NeuD family)
MIKKNKLILIGDSAFAEVAYEYFMRESHYEVVCFAVEKAYLTKKKLFGLPVVPFEEMSMRYNPKEHYFYAALVYSNLNRLRTRLYLAAKQMGFRPASFISPKAEIWPNVEIGEHCFIFEGNNIQAFSKIGDNVVLWSGNHVGHHSVIQNHCFIASHVVISGFCNIGQSCFLGVNATLGNNVTIGQDCWLGPNIALLKDAPPKSLYGLTEPQPSRVDTHRFFKVKE